VFPNVSPGIVDLYRPPKHKGLLKAMVFPLVSNFVLVGGFNLSEKYESQLG
jgi:hypothetical protein